MILKPEFAFPLSYYLIPFTGVVGMIIIVMCVVLVSMHMLQCLHESFIKLNVAHL